MDENQKKVDESWKTQVEKEKEAARSQKPSDADFMPPAPDFSFFVTTLALQASISLGVAPNPQTDKPDLNLPQAKFLIDTLGILQEKTKGNLTPDEIKLLDNIVYELRVNYLAQQNAPNHPAGSGTAQQRAPEDQSTQGEAQTQR